MKKHPLYKQLEAYVLANSYTVQQVQNVTRTQAETVTGRDLSGFSNTFLSNAKSLICQTIQRADDEADKQFLAGQFTDIFERFPDFEVGFKRDGDRRVVLLHLDGV